MPRKTDKSVPPPSRKKACVQCRAARARCSLTQTCKRCEDRGLRCRYLERIPLQRHAMALEAAVHAQSAGLGAAQIPPLDEPQMDAARTNNVQIPVDSLAATEYRSGATEPAEAGDVLGLEGLPDNPWMLEEPPLADSSALYCAAEPILSPRPDFLETQWALETPNTVAKAVGPQNPPPFPPANVDLLFPQPAPLTMQPAWDFSHMTLTSTPTLAVTRKLTVGGWMISKHLLGLIKDYPKYFLEGDKLPPFIHRRSHHTANQLDFSADFPAPPFAHSLLPAALANCACIVQMFYHKTPASTPFIWKTIMDEQCRIVAEVKDADKWQRLAGIQALTIYLLLQAAESTVNPNVALPFLLSLDRFMNEKIVNLLFERDDALAVDTLKDASEWSEWVYGESARRTLAVLAICDMLLQMNITDNVSRPRCQGFAQVPLPSIQALWEADTADEWRRHLDAHRKARRGKAVLRVRCFREVAMCTRSSHPPEYADVIHDLALWSDKSGEFGLVVMLAAQLSGQETPVAHTCHES